MSPWSGAEPESAEEAKERDLFARRARALEPAEVPSLASVLRAAGADRNVAEAHAIGAGSPRGARGRALVAMGLTAACMAAAITRLPHPQASGAIAAEIDASTPRATRAATLTPEPAASAPTCTLVSSGGRSLVSSGGSLVSSGGSLTDEVLVSEETACFTPELFSSAASATSIATFASGQTPLLSPASLTCVANE